MKHVDYCRRLSLLMAASFLVSTQSNLANQSHKTPSGKTPSNGFTDIKGTYWTGNGYYGTQIQIRANGSFKFKTDRDAKGVPDIYNAGACRLDDDLLTLLPKAPVHARESWERLPVRLLVVPWQDRHYLIPLEKSELLWFCNAINSGMEPRGSIIGGPYLRQGDEKRRVSGWPQLPVEWQGYLLKRPLEGSVTALIDSHTATIAIGSKQGLKVGMLLLKKETRPDVGWLEVKDVQENKATVLAAGCDLPVTVGDTVTTLRYSKSERITKIETGH